MYNTYYTIIGKTVTCPKWNVKVTLDGKYRLSDEKGKSTRGTLCLQAARLTKTAEFPCTNNVWNTR